MKKFIKEYDNPNEKNVNYGLINKEYDADLVKYLVNSCKSLEILKYIKFKGYEYIDDESKIDFNVYMNTRNRNSKNKDEKYMYMTDSRYGELRVKFLLTCKNETTTIVKRLLVPVPDRDGYYTIKGKKYFLMYQLVEASTYTSRQNLILKSLMPVTIKRNQYDIKDTDGNIYTTPVNMVVIFKKDTDVLLFFFAKIGVSKTLEYFSVGDIIHFTENEKDKENNLYFQINNKLYLEVNRYFFNKYQYVQGIAGMILSNCTNRLSVENLDDKLFWIEKLGSKSATKVYKYYEKGISNLTSFDRLVDETTKEILKIHSDNKKSVYSIIRWLIQEFNELRKKDNMDLDNKRLRCNEYIAALLTKTFSDKLNRIISLGAKVSLEDVKSIFKFRGDILLQQLYKSGLLRYDDRINDMDFFSKLKFTIKGPNALGNKNENNIQIKYRGIHPSYLGKIDINVCGNSDPGTSGTLTPFCETDGLQFNKAFEPEEFRYHFEKDMNAFLDKNGYYVVAVSDNLKDYLSCHERFADINNGIIVKEKEIEDKYYYINIDINRDDEYI